ncbi:rCG31036 [Rattus norvegicus]|uniref:RCG31036 n=1 Tax=Rattus norvegicus TaxID=10116 RepID=A6IUV3_RAT|nr:rCG31036 [Rattus norvegicus]
MGFVSQDSVNMFQTAEGPGSLTLWGIPRLTWGLSKGSFEIRLGYRECNLGQHQNEKEVNPLSIQA